MSDYMKDCGELENETRKKMFLHARDALVRHSPQKIAEGSGIDFDEGMSAFSFYSLGQKIKVDFPSCLVTFADRGEALNWLWGNTTLHYMELADGTALSGELISFSELSGGMTRGYSFDRESSRTIAREFGQKPPENIIEACKALGASIVESNADICAVFPLFPRHPITLKIWLADEELEGSGKMLINKESPHYLSTEHAVMAGSMLLDFLAEQYRLMFRED